MTIFKFPNLEEKILVEDPNRNNEDLIQLEEHKNLRDIMEAATVEDKKALQKESVRNSKFRDDLVNSGFELNQSRFLKRKGVLTGGHFSRWDVITATKEDSRFVIKIVNNKSSMISSILRERKKTNALRDLLAEEEVFGNFGSGQKRLGALPCEFVQASDNSLLVYPLLTTQESSYESDLGDSILAYKLLHSLDPSSINIGRLRFEDLENGSPEIFGGYSSLFDKYGDEGLFSQKFSRDITDLFEAERHKFEDLQRVVHGDPKVGEHLLLQRNDAFLIDLERLMITNPLIDYAIMSTRALRTGQPHLERNVHSAMHSEMGNSYDQLFRLYRAYYVLTEVFNTAIQSYNHLTSIDVIPERKKAEFGVLLRRTYDDLVIAGTNEQQAYQSIKDVWEIVNENCKND